MTGHGKRYRLRGAEVTECKGLDGSVAVLRDGRQLPLRLLVEGAAAPPVADGKRVRQRVDRVCRPSSARGRPGSRRRTIPDQQPFKP